jgi:hypothetical protein
VRLRVRRGGGGVGVLAVIEERENLSEAKGRGTWKLNTERGEGNHPGSVALQSSTLGTLADMLCTTSIGFRRTKTLVRMRLHQEQVACVCPSICTPRRWIDTN